MIITHESKNKKQRVEDPQEQRVVFDPRLVQPHGNALKDLRTDIDDQDGEESSVQADRKPRPEKIIAHDNDQHQHAGYDKAVVHFASVHLSPSGDLSYEFLPGAFDARERDMKKRYAT